MQQFDKMTLTILEDGTAKLEIDGISGANHTTAERLVKEFAALLGGELRVEKRPQRFSVARHTHRRTQS